MLRLHRFFPPAVGILLPILAAPRALASTNLGNGISYDTANGYHSVVADLASIGTEVRVTLPHQNGGQEDTAGDMITVQNHALEEGATVAINGNYFGGTPNYPCGAGRGFGVQYLDGYEEAVNCETTMGWTTATPSNTGAIYDSYGHSADATFMKQYSDLVTGGGYLLSGGQPHAWNTGKLEAGRDCTAAGISADRKHFIMVVTDDTVCDGTTLQNVLLAHGAADALQLDGGGSSKMWISGMGYVNDEPQDRAPPVVIFARPNGECPSDCGSAVCVQLLRPFRAQCVGQACRAGLGNIWNCDQDQKERARCDNGVVVRECCAMGCMPQPNGQDDQCIGGAVPCAAGGDAGSDASAASDAAPNGPTDGAAASIDGASSQDSGVTLEDASPAADTDASATNRAARAGSSSGCGCRTTREGDSVSLASIATVAAIAIYAFGRRRRRG
jgi:MYXO-CTERM domain-containing protein